MYGIVINALLGSLALICVAGLVAARRVSSAEGWTTAGRTLPSGLLALSWISAEFSAMTILGVPAAAYQGDWSLLQFFFGSVFARIVIVFVFLQKLYGRGPDLYAYLGERFGPKTESVASGFFLSARTLLASVRLLAVAAITDSFFQTHDVPWIAVFSAVAVIAVAIGGVRSAVWTGCIQAAAIFLGGFTVLAYLVGSFEGGVSEALRVAGNAERLVVWNWRAPAAILTGFFGSLAAFGTDQETLQRLFAARSRMSAKRAVIFAAVASAVVLILFLSIGTGLFVFYDQRRALELPIAANSILPHFAFQAMPDGQRGILLVALVLASIDLPLVGLSTIFPGPGNGGVSGLRQLRWGSIGWGVLLAGCALGLSHFSDWVWIGFKIGGVVYGPLLGVFVVGFYGPRRSDWAATISLISTAAGCLGALWMIEKGLMTTVEWRWLPAIGAVTAASMTEMLSRSRLVGRTGQRGIRSRSRQG